MAAISCKGFRFAGVPAGIKRDGALDLGLIVADGPATGAAVFTRNEVKAAPVLVSQRALARNRGDVRAVVVNSGNANACTGDPGLADARAMAAAAARAAGVPRRSVLVASTGVIGAPLPMQRVEAGIERAGAALGRDFRPFAEAILTTDTAAKIATRRVTVGGKRARLIGCTKGAGMIAPNMATTLTFVCTDAKLPVGLLRASLRRAAAETFNAITVDGDCSTNDMIALLASGAAGNAAATASERRAFGAALTDLLEQLATELMAGGEGVHHVVTVRVTGARSRAAAAAVARAIAVSPLVKTAIAGCDPNWGRVLCAAGNAGVRVDPHRLALWIDRVQLVAAGVGVPDRRAEARAARTMRRPRYALRVDLGAGSAEARYLACDLSREYVAINADYRT